MKKGLTSSHAGQLLKQYGLNVISEQKKKNILIKLIEQFNNFLTILLIIAALFSFFIKEAVDGILIISIVVLNAFFGIYQEAKAEESIAALKKMTVTKVRVIRDGKEQEIDSKFLVPGDIVFIEEGTKISADGIVIEAMNLEVNEAALTGESLPTSKSQIPNPTSAKLSASKSQTNSNFQNPNNNLTIEQFNNENLVFSGTIVTKGRGLMRVTATGMRTKFGSIASHLSIITDTKTPLQKKLEALIRLIGIFGIVLAGIVFLLSFLEGSGYFPAFLLAISLAVAVVPEGLPAVMTITLAIGVKRMAVKKAIMRKLSAIEALGSITLIATDKTGTLTSNKMKVKEIYVDGKILDINSKRSASKIPHRINRFWAHSASSVQASQNDEKKDTFSLLILNGVLCSTASLSLNENNECVVLGDPTEGALLYLAEEVNYSPEIIKQEWKLLQEKPFDSVSKTMSIIVEDQKSSIKNQRYLFSKGAPESILANCGKILVDGKEKQLSEIEKGKIEHQVDDWARKGLRVLAFGYKSQNNFKFQISNFKCPKNLTFLGLVAIHDAPRPEVVDAVKRAHESGIRVVMITGDNEKTAEAVGVTAGIFQKGDMILKGSDIENYNDDELSELLPKTSIFARINPFQKFRIVKLYQELGEVVAVTGDGVNDAIALKQADVGVAMGLVGTDVARETADMVITDDNFATIVNAIEEGRNIIKNLKNAIKYLLSCNISEAIALVLGLILGIPTLFYAIQLLYINLVTDGLPALSLAFSPRNPHVMQQKPEKIMTLLKTNEMTYILMVGIIASLIILISYFWFLPIGLGKTAAFTILTLIQSFILIDLWLSHQSIKSHWKLLLSPIFILAFSLPFLMQYMVVSQLHIAQIFKIQTVSVFTYLQFVLISGLVLLGIKGIKVIVKI